jgi:hypothetical protein
MGIIIALFVFEGFLLLFTTPYTAGCKVHITVTTNQEPISFYITVGKVIRATSIGGFLIKLKLFILGYFKIYCYTEENSPTHPKDKNELCQMVQRTWRKT